MKNDQHDDDAIAAFVGLRNAAIPSIALWALALYGLYRIFG